MFINVGLVFVSQECIATQFNPSIGHAMSHDTTVKKISSATAPAGAQGQMYLASGKHVSMRLWREEPQQEAPESVREYETVGFVISGRAELETEGQTVSLEPGDSWLVPAGARHRYTILEDFTAVEATSPPAQVRGRDALPNA